MVTQVSKPGVNIRQVFQGTVPAPVTPQLIPCIVGPGFEVVDVLDSAGAPSAVSRVPSAQGTLQYVQIPLSIDPLEFPTPHADAAEMQVLADEVDALLVSSGATAAPSRSSAFLCDLNLGQRPGVFVVYDTDDVLLTNLNIGLDVVAPDAVSADIHISVAANSTPAALAQKINDAAGRVVAQVLVDADRGTGVHIESARFGAAASVTLRKVSGGFTSTFLNDVCGLDASIRVEGAGLYADTSFTPTATATPFVAHSVGKLLSATSGSLVNATVDVASLNAVGIYPTQRDVAGVLTFGTAQVIDFEDLEIRAATATSNGDLLTASNVFGQSISQVMVTGVEGARLRLGVPDTLRSTYDAEGNPSLQRYNDFALNTLTGGSAPFAPKNGFVVAQSLSVESDATASELRIDDITDLGDYTPAASATLSVTGVSDAALLGAVGLSISAAVTHAGVTTTGTHTITVADSLATLADTLTAAFDGVVVSVDGNAVTLTTEATGLDVSLAISGAWSTIGAVSGVVDAGADAAITSLLGNALSIRFNDGSHVYTIVGKSTSLPVFIDDVNNAVGVTVLSLEESALVLKSPLVGVGSKVSVSGDLADDLGLSAVSMSSGTGRPVPALRVGAGGVVHLAADIFRSGITGRPLNISADVHVGYRALRTDLSAEASAPGLLRVSNLSDLESIYGPVDVRNPLALGMYFALLNSGDGVEVTALGVDAVSSAEPEGTVGAYARALEFLRGYEVYAIAPMTASEDVISLCNAHVSDMSEPSMRGERVVISAPHNPTRRNDVVVLSAGADGADSTGNELQIDLNQSPEAVLAGAGVDTSGVIPFEQDNGQQLYLMLVIGADTFRLSVKSVDGARVTLRAVSELTTAQNADGFYTGSDLPSAFSGADYSLALRGTTLTLPGSVRLDKTAYAETVRDKAQQYMNRRQLRLYPDTVVSSSVGGVLRRLPSFYWGAALAGACANLPAQEPFTRVPLVGFTDVVGPVLDRAHYDIISAGNSVLEVEVSGQLPALRMQSTTDPSTIESREWSATRAVDLFAKTLRAQLRSRIGRYNITQSYLDELSMLVDSLCMSAVAAGLFRSTNVTRLEQDPSQPDTILVAVSVEVLYPANYIDVTVVV